MLGVVYRGDGGDASLIRGPGDIAVGDRIVLLSSHGGHDEWGWTSTRGAIVRDVGDLAPTRRRGVLRIARSVFDTWAAEDDDQRAAIEASFALLDSDDPERTAVAAIDALLNVPVLAPLHSRLEAARSWRKELVPGDDDLLNDHGRPVLIAIGQPHPIQNSGDDAISDEDTTSTSLAGVPLQLNEHGAQVADMARKFAEHLRLPPELTEAVALAGRYHDLGKADERFQAALRDGDLVAARAAGELLAKSGRNPRDPAARRARELAHLPAGFRHEAVSARLLDRLHAESPEVFAGVDFALVRHLVASHHGTSRPLLPPVLDPSAPNVQIEVDGRLVEVEGQPRQVDWEQPGRFEQLADQYGWWGLAYLETLVRLADMLCSEKAR